MSRGRLVAFDTTVKSSSRPAEEWIADIVAQLRNKVVPPTITIGVLERIGQRMAGAPEATNPPEPTGLGAVVEASCVHSQTRLHFVRHPDGNWWCDRGGDPDDYGSLRGVVIKAKGWSPA